MLISTILIVITVLITPSCETPARSRPSSSSSSSSSSSTNTTETFVRSSKLLNNRNTTSSRTRRQQSTSSSSTTSTTTTLSSTNSPIRDMKIELSPTKRPQVGAVSRASTSNGFRNKKRFKSSLNSTLSVDDSLRARTSLDDSNNNNNNPWNSNDLNNNSIASSSDQPAWRRNIDSINGTVDLSQYQQTDVDRLYGDALLVYFKNFNETLPARRETISVNGTAANQIPIYQSVPQTLRGSLSTRDRQT